MLVRNPATGEALTTVPKSTSDEILHVVESSVKAFKLWSNTSRGERQDKLYILASLIRNHEADIVSLVELFASKSAKPAWRWTSSRRKRAKPIRMLDLRFSVGLT